MYNWIVATFFVQDLIYNYNVHVTKEGEVRFCRFVKHVNLQAAAVFIPAGHPDKSTTVTAFNILKGALKDTCLAHACVMYARTVLEGQCHTSE